MKQYRITGRFRYTKKRHVVDIGFKSELAAKIRLDAIKKENELKMENRKCKATQVGMISVSTQYDSDYDLLDLRIEEREVTPWEELK